MLMVVYTKELKYVRKIGSHGDGPGQFGGMCMLLRPGPSDFRGVLGPDPSDGCGCETKVVLHNIMILHGIKAIAAIIESYPGTPP